MQLLKICVLLTLAESISAADHIARPQSSKFFIAECDAGFANRLRVLSFFMSYTKYFNAELLFIWEVNAACPGHFLETFQPLDGVTFISRKHASYFEQPVYRVMRSNNTRADIKILLRDLKFHKFRSGHVLDTSFRKFLLTPRMQLKVAEFVVKHNICNAISVHSRITDLAAGLTYHQHMSAERHIWWLRSSHAREHTEKKIFLACDSPITQKLFIDTFGDRIIVQNEMKLLPDMPFPTGSPNENPITNATEFRYTSFEDAVVDAYIASYANYTRLNPYSSYSEHIKLLQVQRMDYKDVPLCPSNKDINIYRDSLTKAGGLTDSEHQLIR